MDKREDYLEEVVRCARRLTVRGSLVFRNDEHGQRVRGGPEGVAYAFVGLIEDHDAVRDALYELERFDEDFA